MSNPHWQTSRRIGERIVIEGCLELLTPAHFGGSKAEDTADLTLLRDTHEGMVLLPGASIAGALRNHWRERKRGYSTTAQDSELFGAKRGAHREMEGHQSLLIVDDAIGQAPQVELRDGVKIAGATRTAEEKKLFDMEVLRAGTTLPLRFELLIPTGQREALCRDLALALEGFEREEIGLGARKRRGFGRCRVTDWHVWRYNLTMPDELLTWLAEGREWDDAGIVVEAKGENLAAKLGITADVTDLRHRVEFQADFALAGALLVRSGPADIGPDVEHIHRLRYNQDNPDAVLREPVLPGTSLAGVLRARAIRIVNTLTQEPAKARCLIDQLFGSGPEDIELDSAGDERKHRASRLLVHEAVITNVRSLVQHRIRIDRFTGGAMDNYLFNEAPIFGGEDSCLTLELSLRNPTDYEIGLLLLLLKDLWTGELPVGGESGIGRGRLRGLGATLTRIRGGEKQVWTMEQIGSNLLLTPETSQALEGFVGELNRYLAGEVNDDA